MNRLPNRIVFRLSDAALKDLLDMRGHWIGAFTKTDLIRCAIRLLKEKHQEHLAKLAVPAIAATANGSHDAPDRKIASRSPAQPPGPGRRRGRKPIAAEVGHVLGELQQQRSDKRDKATSSKKGKHA